MKLTIARLFAMAMVSAALIVAAVVGCAVAAQADTAPRQFPVIQLADWPHAYTLMASDHWWCEVAGPTPPRRHTHPLLACTPARPRQLAYVVNFYAAMQTLRYGGAITHARNKPHVWLVTWRWF